MRDAQKKFLLGVIKIAIIIFIAIIILCIWGSKTFDVRKESDIIYRWKNALAEAQYSYNVVLLTEDNVLKAALTLDDDGRNKEIMKLFGKTHNFQYSKSLKRYKYKFLNGKKVPKHNKYYVDDFVIAPKYTIVGINWADPKCFDTKKVCGILIFDMNGKTKPNRFGVDVFGVNIYHDRLEPFGAELDYSDIEKNCDKYQSGVACSQFYLIGGQFFK